MSHKKKQVFRFILILSSIASLYFAPLILVKGWILPLPHTVQEQLDEAVNLGFEGGIVYIDKKGNDPIQVASGWNNRETKTPANPNSLLKIASINKLYDAVAVTKLVSRGRLSLD